MYAFIKNENYGYAVATYGDYVAVGNPAILRWTAESMSVLRTGSLDYFRYNKNTDQHDYVGTIFKNVEDIDVILATENTGAYPFYNINTEDALLPSFTEDILIDKTLYTSSVEDGFGFSLDMYGKTLVVGSPYFTQIVATSASVTTASGTTVELHDLSKTELGATVSTYLYTIYNPDTTITNSFGHGVSINSKWIAISSPYVSSSAGMIYMYRNLTTGSAVTWSLYQKLNAPSGSISEALYGWDLKLNKQSGSYSQSMIVGCGNNANAQAYYYEIITGSWTLTHIFNPTTNWKSLTFGPFMPYDMDTSSVMNVSNGYGRAVSLYDSTVVIGAPYDRAVYEFSGSGLYQQGATYVYEKCLDITSSLETPYSQFVLNLKTYGTPLTIKNNRMGYSVDAGFGYAVSGIPKINNEGITSCYVGGTLDQLHQCASDLENALTGQAMLLQKNTSSGDWEIVNVYQRKKRYLSPYRSYGNDVSIDGRSMVVGAPLLLTDSNRFVNLNTTSSSGMVLDDISGKAYIYNLANLRDEFHVGNVFYRNGKIVIMTSGSVFDGLFFNPINANTYEYDLQFKGQHTIYEKQIICQVAPGEFNVSTNPSAIHRLTGSFDVNGNGIFDFQDVDVILRYMQYKNTTTLGTTVSTDWTSSLLKTDDEKSLYEWNISQSFYNVEATSTLASESIVRWETEDTWVQNVLDLNEDNKIDVRDMNIVWKYFTYRLTQENYATYITPSCKKKLFSDVIDYLNFMSQRYALPEINHEFQDYERLTALDKTGSFLAPYTTTIGLYDGLDLVAVAKLGTPIKITPELPINFVVKMDW